MRKTILGARVLYVLIATMIFAGIPEASASKHKPTLAEIEAAKQAEAAKKAAEAVGAWLAIADSTASDD